MVLAQSQLRNLGSLQFLDSLGLGPVSGHAFEFVSSSKLTIPASAEKENLVFLRDQACVSASTGHALHFFFEEKFFGSSEVLPFFMAELSVVSITPSENLAFLSYKS